MAATRAPEPGPNPAPPPTLDEVLKAAAVQAAALALLNAVQHLQRTSLLTEAAIAGGLARALASGDRPETGWAGVLEASGQAMDAATRTFREALALANGLASRPLD